MKILIIEDIPQLLQVLTLYCQKHGNHEIRTALTLKEADEVRKEFVPDAVLSDNRLPDGLGPSRFQDMRDQNPRVMICLMTGDQKEPEGHKADFFLHKPMPDHEMFAVLNEMEQRFRSQ